MSWRLCIESGTFASAFKFLISIVFSLTIGAGLFSFDVEAQNRARKKIPSQKAFIEVDGAALYSKPTFDAPVLDYLRAGTQVIATLKPRKGYGDFGLFFGVKTRDGKIGYMADTDLVPEYNLKKSKRKPVAKNPVFEEAKDAKENPNREPLYFTRYIGGGLGMLGFTEKFAGVGEKSSQVTMFALKMTGPGTLFDGPPLDFNFAFSLGSPKYYEDFSNGPAGGFFLFTDLLLNSPLFEIPSGHGMVFYGLGAMATYTRFKPTIGSSSIDSEELRIGAALSIGYAHRWGKYSVRWDSKYYYEVTDYLGHWLSFQVEYK